MQRHYARVEPLHRSAQDLDMISQSILEQCPFTVIEIILPSNFVGRAIICGLVLLHELLHNFVQGALCGMQGLFQRFDVLKSQTVSENDIADGIFFESLLEILHYRADTARSGADRI